MPWDVNDRDFLPTYEQMQRSLQAAWEASLQLTGCIECARLDLAQQLRLMADAKAGDRDLPQTCAQCQTPPAPGAVRFFKHGTDERI